MNAFEAAGKDGRSDELRTQLVDLFDRQNVAEHDVAIPATFLKVTVNVPGA